MPAPTLRTAVVGLLQGLENVYSTLHHPRYTLSALCDVSRRPWEWLTGERKIEDEGPEAAIFPHHIQWVKRSAAHPDFAAVEFTSDYDALLTREDIDAVILVLPDVLHREYAVKALEAGKFVLSTKPMAATVEDAFEIAAAARKHTNHFMLGFQLTYSPFTTTVLDIIASGEIGAPRVVRFDYHRGPWRPVHRRKYDEVDGAMRKEGGHWLDLFYRLSGQLPWRAISGFGALDKPENDFEFEDNGILAIDYDGFRAAHSFTYFRDPLGEKEDFLLVGEKGLIRGDLERFTVDTDAGAREVVVPSKALPELYHTGYYEMHDEFAAMALDGREPYTSWQTGLENTLTSYAAQIAVAEGRTVQRGELADIDWRQRFSDTKA
ncbi:Gfo/Idh/MocA family oxidoreductase [Streptomyces sp. NPDC048636]|uniref:Gfo/Idh/MocA family protein n=1 Tax=Streptomyces sp. NPDC048636 TaxID=3155762 RepID=UPI00344A3865